MVLRVVKFRKIIGTLLLRFSRSARLPLQAQRKFSGRMLYDRFLAKS